MPRLPLVLALTAALAASSANAAKFTYHGALMDGDAPADGTYDLRLRSFASSSAKAAAAGTTELAGVQVRGGRFAVELDLPENRSGDTYVEVAVRKSGGNDKYETLGAPQPVAKVNGACPGAWALDGNSGAPVGSYLGFADAKPVTIKSAGGVVLNQSIDPEFTADLTIHAKSGGDADADLALVTDAGRTSTLYVSDDTGALVLNSGGAGIVFNDGMLSADQNNGLAPFGFSGRLRSGASGAAAADTSGGIWFDDERANASFVGRPDNQSNWTGIYEATGGWRFTVFDNGGIGFNTGTEALGTRELKVLADSVQGIQFNVDNPVTTTFDLTLGARASIGDADFDAAVVSRSGKRGTIALLDANGILQLRADSATGSTRFSLGGGFNDQAGSYLTTGANGASLTTGGTWTNGSSRAFKHAFEAIDAGDVLARVVALPLSRWQYRDSQEGKHLGPMAEDFSAAFGLGGSTQHISTVDADGVALAAIQGLNAKLEAENATLRARLDALELRMATVAAQEH